MASMAVSVTPPPAERLLSAAARLFAAEGIRAVGIDRLISESGVARASLYQSFGSKDQLIAEYLRRQHDTDRRAWQTAVRAMSDPVARVLAFFDCAARAATKRKYSGCLYLNAAAEFPEREHPVWTAIAEHRRWVRDTISHLLTEAGVRAPDHLAATVQLLYDGALAGSKLERSVEPIVAARRLASAQIDSAKT
jgi:AcrR family transcriptional regulator